MEPSDGAKTSDYRLESVVEDDGFRAGVTTN